MTNAAITKDAGPSRQDMLGVYLNDHLAGATAGSELASRMANSYRDREEGVPFSRIAIEIAQDRSALLTLMAWLGVEVRGDKVIAAWIGEKIGRLKFNGRLLGRSPLSELEELEVLRLAIEGKAAGWRTLRTLADTDPRLDADHLDELIAGARSQEPGWPARRTAGPRREPGHQPSRRPGSRCPGSRRPGSRRRNRGTSQRLSRAELDLDDAGPEVV
jgi:hypothetical protein